MSSDVGAPDRGTDRVVDVDEFVKPLPQPDNVSAHYWMAAAEGKLLVQRCPRCGATQFYPRALCATCGGDPEWLETNGTGTVHTYTVVRQMGMRAFRDEVPYVVAMVELDEGPMVMGNVTDCPPDDVHIGLRVEAHFVRVDESTGIPYWRPETAQIPEELTP
jgi:uncharacterized OB-fold protein